MKHHSVLRRGANIAGGLVAVLVTMLLLTGYAAAQVVDRVVAVVNDEVITLSELEEEAAGLYANIARSTSTAPIREALAEAREVALENLIDQRLIIQRARQQKIDTSEAEIDASYERMRQSSGLSAEEFSRKLEMSGLTEEKYRQRLRLQNLQGKLVSVDVHSRVAITEEMIREAYQVQYGGQGQPESFYLLQMGFSWPEAGNDPVAGAQQRAETLNRAKEVQARVKSGGDFKSLAKEFSDLPSAEDGGDIGLFAPDEMAPAMRVAVQSLQPGELSEIIETPAGYQFFQVLSSQESGAATTAQYETVRESIRERLQDEKLKEAYAEWVKKLKEDAYIQKL